MIPTKKPCLFCSRNGLPGPERFHLQFLLHRGSFTVEASLIMTILLPVLAAILYLGFCDHDRGILMGAACEITATADNMLWKKNPGNGLDRKASSLAKQHLLCARNVKTQVSVSEDHVRVSYSGSFSLPGILPRLFGKGVLSVDQQRDRVLLHPTDVIRTIRGLEYMTDRLSEAQ